MSMMHSRTLWVLAGMVMLWGVSPIPTHAQQRQADLIKTAAKTQRAESAGVSGPRTRSTRMKTISGSSEIITIRQSANSRAALRGSTQGGSAATVSTTKKVAQGLRKLDTSNFSITPLHSSTVAGNTIPGTEVYRNDGTDNIAGVYTPGAGERMADDISLAGGGCNIVHYSVGVAGFDSNGCDLNFPGDPLTPFTVDLALWDGDPCAKGSSIIPGSTFTSQVIPSDCIVFIIDALLPAPVSAPDTIYLAATFSTDDSGWVVAERAEVGDTGDFWSEDNIDTDPDLNGCVSLFFGNAPGAPYAGFFASVNCNLAEEPPGACCDGNTCSETTEAVCPLGFWKGAFSSCDPSPCLAGACCSGETFGDCLDVTEAQCTDGIFRAGELCSNNACGSTHVIYANTFETFTFTAVGTNELMGDDIRFDLDTPCELVAYELLVAGGGPGPTEFNVEMGIWNNMVDPNNPDDESFDIPDGIIPGTDATFINIPANGARHRLLVTVAPGIILQDKIWVVMTTNTPRDDPNAGPLLGGLAKYNHSLDAFALFNSPDFGADVWAPGIFFSGYNPDLECVIPGDPNPPGPGFCPAGSMRIKMYCNGDRPSGACCDNATGGCTDGLRSFECDSRFMPGTTCAENLFDPPCGTGACCHTNPFDPNALICTEELFSDCARLSGAHDPTTLCTGASAPCPSFIACVGSTSSCFSAVQPGSQQPGCNDAPCCERVCNSLGGDFCCTTEWDQACADTAADICILPPDNDDWENATPIAGVGVFDFDSSFATHDGPSNTDCTILGDLDTITNDVWFCWESPCTDTVFFKTCESPAITLMDTMVAVYGDCDLPPDDSTLLVCNDDTCNTKSQVSFNATSGQSYLLRAGTFPGQEGDVGTVELTCGPPPRVECTLGAAAGECCDDVGTGTPGCSDESCCSRVCACDPFCCNVTWDADCATNGFLEGCGAAVICTDLCGGCPAGSVEWIDPLQGTVDAGLPHDPNNAAAVMGIDTIQVNAPLGAGSLACWTLCETANGGSPNSITNIIDNGAGDYTIELARPITSGAVTTINYTGDGVSGVFTAHPGNVNGDGVSSAADVLAIIDILNGEATATWGSYSSDIDRSGETTQIDILRLIDELNGADSLEPWMSTPNPAQTGCP